MPNSTFKIRASAVQLNPWEVGMALEHEMLWEIRKGEESWPRSKD